MRSERSSPHLGSGPRADRRGITALLLILVLAAALRIHRIGAEGLWFDECYSLISASGNVKAYLSELSDAREPRRLSRDYTWVDGFAPLAIWRDAPNDVHPPLYAIALSGWRSVFGQGDVAARSLSTVCSVALIAIVATAVRRQTGRWRSALWTAAILAASSQQIYFGQEARGYALMWCLVYAVVALVIDARRRSTLNASEAIAIGALMYAAMLTHYLAAGPLLGIAVWVGCTPAIRRRFMLATLVAAIVFAATWLVLLIGRPHATMGWTQTIGPGERVVLLLQLCWRHLLLLRDAPHGMSYASGLALVVPICFAQRVPAVRPWLAVACGAIALVFAADVMFATAMLQTPRFTLAAMPAVWAAVCIVASRARLTRDLVPLLVLCTCFAYVHDVYRLPKDEWPRVAQWLRSEAVGGDDLIVVVVDDRAFSPPRMMLVAAGHYGGWPRDARPAVAIIDAPPSTALRAAMKSAMRSAHRVIVIHAGLGKPPAEWFDDCTLTDRFLAFPIAHGFVALPSTMPATSTSVANDQGGGAR